ncbi:bifunctional hydroxymethylpyrimidine kinase/phosphomethylpyrimidine kinase [Candidatus Sumerlaeota bacterium]|nr:bifunctional hydroxymethylpyrimidine kinase/phosphomethylpyrimidine kinase [Candidatus Sumerlaeota bacterium]
MTDFYPKAITIAGSDPSGGAGIQADLKTFCAFEVYGAAALTALTAQSTQGVAGAHYLPLEFFALQLETVLDDIEFHAGKTGMLADADIIHALSEVLERHPLPNLVVDPVMTSKHGAPLLAPEANQALAEKIFPKAAIVTPNLHEAGRLTGRLVRDRDEMLEAAKRIHGMGPQYVLIKGGHLSGTNIALDLLWDGSEAMEFERPRLDATHTHGTGCTLSAALAANLALGRSMEAAVAIAKDFVHSAIRAGYPIGKGIGPVDHLWQFPQKHRMGR